jgi:hypothetical protein
VIGKITAPRGERVEGLIWYLFGPGRHEEHTDPHIVAGWRHSAELERRCVRMAADACSGCSISRTPRWARGGWR